MNGFQQLVAMFGPCLAAQAVAAVEQYRASGAKNPGRGRYLVYQVVRAQDQNLMPSSGKVHNAWVWANWAADEKARDAQAAAKAGADAQIAALVAIGYGQASAAELVKPDCMGYVGFPGYSLSNSNARIRDMQQRLARIERDQAKPVEVIEAGNGVSVERDAPANRVRLYFPGKPDEAVRARLKKNGFRWAPSQGAWSAYLNNWSVHFAEQLAAELAQA
ncbi:MAG: hypothetical protein R3E87_15115 [Burkholderiaceae bacterium]